VNKSNVISGYLYRHIFYISIFRKMKKGIVVILIIIIIFSIVSFFPITQNSTINISATFDNTVLQIVHVEDWKNWYPEIKEAYKSNPADYSFRKDSSNKIDTIIIPGKKFIIHTLTPMSYNISEVGNHMENNFAFTVFPGGAKNKMKIFLVNRSPLIFTLLNINKAGENALNGFRNYMESPEEFYGFDIKMAEIRDPIIASLVTKIKEKDIFHQIQISFTDLMNYLNTNKLIKTGHISISYIPLQGDSLQITVGIPVDKVAAPADGISCLSLPAKGKVLVGNYEGKFSDRQKIYNAMTKYLTDHALSIPAESFERYLNDLIPTSDSSEIKIELDYPVY